MKHRFLSLSLALLFGTAAFAADGDLDTSYNTPTGFNSATFGASDNVYGGILQPDGKLIVIGGGRPVANQEMSVARFNPNGTLDTTFGGGTGKFSIDITPATNTDRGTCGGLQSDGKIIIGGYTRFASGNDNFAVIRLNTNGTLDTTFGTSGIAQVDFNTGSDRASALVVLADNSIVMAGFASDFSGSPDIDLGVAKLTPSGAADTSFSGDGKLTVDIGDQQDDAKGIAVQSDGMLVFCGQALGTGTTSAVVGRLTSTGVLDTTFGGGDGLFTSTIMPLYALRSLLIDTDGKIVVAGDGQPSAVLDGLVMRLSTTGDLDTTFNTTGYLNIDFGSGSDGLNSIVRQTDGKYVAGGTWLNSVSGFLETVLVRVTTAGALDGTFATAGVKKIALGAGSNRLTSIHLASDGKILASLEGGASSAENFIAARFEGAPAAAPEIAVTETTAGNIPDNTGAVSFGITTLGTPVTRTFTVTNSGTATLNLSALSVPSGFSIAQDFASSTVAASGGTTTFQVTMSAAAAATPSGLLSFTNDDGDENPFTFTISGTVDRPNSTVTSIDRITASSTNTSSVTWRIVFNQPVSGLVAANFALANTGLTAPSITGVSAVTGSPDTTWQISASTGTGTGTLGLNLSSDTGLSHAVTNTPFTGQIYDIDKIAPTAGIVVADASLTAGETSLVTITFSEAVSGFDNSDLTIPNGALTAVSSGDGGITWTANFTPSADTEAATNVITLAMTGVTDAAGNAGAGTTDSNNFAIDNIRPTLTLTSSVADPAPNVAFTLTATFSEGVTGFSAGEIITTNAVIGTFTRVSSTVYTLVLIPDGSGLPVTANVDVNLANDAAGNGNTAATQFTRATYSKATISAAFGSAQVAINGTATLTYTLTNPNASHALTGVEFTDLLPAGLALGTTPLVTNDLGGTLTAAASTRAITLSGGVLDPGETTTVVLNITGTVTGVNRSNYLIVTSAEAPNITTQDVFKTTSNTVASFNAPPLNISRLFHDRRIITGSVDATDTTQTGRLNRFGAISQIGVNKGFPGTFTTTDERNYETHNIVNSTASPQDVNLWINTSGTGGFVVAYLDSFDPTSLGTNYLADPGSSWSTSGYMGFTIPAGRTVVIVVHSTNLGQFFDYALGINTPFPAGAVSTIPATLAALPTIEVVEKSVSIADLAAISEGNSGTTNFVFTVTRTGATTGSVAMTYTVGGVAVDTADFGGTFPTGTATIPDGSATTTVTIPVRGDTTRESDEAFTVTLSAPDNGYAVAGAPATSTIINDDFEANLAVTVTDGVTTEVPGTSVTYSIVASNSGSDPVTGATLSNTFPATITGVTWTAVGAGGGIIAASGSGNINELINLPVGGSVSITATGLISASATGTLANTVTVTAPGGITDPTPGNNSATDTDTLSPEADLSITKTDGVTTAIPGGSTTYTITVSNAGPSNATGVTVADTLPAILTATWTGVGAGGGTGPASGSGNINASNVNLPAGASFTFTVSANISASATGTLSNTATVTAPGGVTDPTPGNNSATDTDTLTPQADLAVTITDSPDPVSALGNLTYSITLTNNGPSTSASPSISLPLPAFTTFVSASGTAGWTPSSPTVGANGIVSFSNSTLSSTGTASFTIVTRVDSNVVNNSTLSATVTATETTTDPTPGNNIATTTTTARSGADLVATLTAAPEPVIAGTDLTYTLQIKNNGPLDADNAALSFTLPAGTTFVSLGSNPGWIGMTPTVGASGIVDITNPLFANAGDVSFPLVVRVGSDVVTGSIINATLTASSSTIDVAPGNESSNAASNVITRSDLGIDLTSTPDITPKGSDVNYSLTLTNNGPSDAVNPSVSFAIPSDMTFVSANGPLDWTPASPSVGSGGTVTFSKSGLTNGSVVSFAIVTKVKTTTANGTVITATASASATGTDIVTANDQDSSNSSVGTVNPTVLQVGTSGTLNSQIGLFEITVNVTNTTPLPINGFRLRAGIGAYPGITLYNATNPPGSSDVYVDYPYPVDVDAVVPVKLSFYTSTRIFPNPFEPVFTVEILSTSAVSDTNDAGVEPRFTKLPDDNFLLEFPSIPGRWYRIRYSNDMMNWFDCPVPILAANNRMQWIDNGAPFTISPSSSVPSRFYIVNEISVAPAP